MAFEQRHSRQALLIPDTINTKSMLIIGGGGIGSNALHMAVSTGLQWITVVDYDIVGEENIFPGFFGQPDVGLPKTRALAKATQELYGVTLDTYEATSMLAWQQLEGELFDIALVCTDNLPSRQEALEKALEMNLCEWWIDARMGGTGASVYCFCLDDTNYPQVQDYQKTFGMTHTEEPCGMKATAALTKGFIAGMIGQCIYDIANDNQPPFEQRYNLSDRMFLSIPFGTIDKYRRVL